MQIERINYTKKTLRRKEGNTKYAALAIFIAIAAGAVYLAITLNYAGALVISPLAASSRVPFSSGAYRNSSGILNGSSGLESTYLSGENGNSAALILWNGTVNTSNGLCLPDKP